MSGPSYQSVPEMFLDRVAKTPNGRAFLYPRGGDWETITWRETSERVRALASGLKALGLKSEERVAIFSGTRIEWILADLAILCAGGATTTIYPSNSAEDCAFIVQDSETVLAFVENDDQIAKLSSTRGVIPKVKNLITFDGKPSLDGWVLTAEQVIEKGKAYEQPNHKIAQRIAHTIK